MNQCLIYGQTLSLIVIPVMMGQVMKESKISITRMGSNRRKWNYLHVGTQQGSDGVTKEH